MAEPQQNRSIDTGRTQDALDDTEKDMTSSDSLSKVVTTEDAMVYPPPAQAALVMLALLLALFLSALVSQRDSSLVALQQSEQVANVQAGSHNHSDSHTCSHGRVQLPQRHRVVRQCVPAHFMLLMPLPRSCLHLLSSEIRLCHSHRSLRDRVSSLRCRTQLHRLHYWSRHRRFGRSRNDVWRHGSHDQCSASREEAGLDGSCWCHDGYRKCSWTSAWRCLDDECELEMVLLQ